MKKKMPQSHPTHVYDKRARKNLEDVFPEHWKLNKTEDFHSGIEYGEDWLCEITDQQNDLTGARFYIQSKATEKKLGTGARRLGMPLKVSTLNRLHELNLPIMLHYYHIPSETGYWMWLDEFYQREYRADWEKGDKKVQVYISTNNILNQPAVKTIMAEVLKFQRLHHLQKQVEIANKVDPNYGFRFEAGHTYVQVGMYPKHPNALEEHPISVNLTVDANANEQIRASAELGLPAQFEAKAIFEGLPQWLMEDVDEQGKVVINLLPLIEEKHSHLQFEYLDAADVPIFKSTLVKMQLVQPGTKYKKYVGRSQRDPLIFTVIFDAIKPQTSFNIAYNHENRSIEALAWYYDLLDRLTNTVNARVHDLDSGQSHLLQNYNAFEKLDEPSEIIRDFIKHLAIISNALKLDILFPKEPRTTSYDEAYLAQAVVEVIQTGITHNLTPIPKEVLEGEGKPVLSGKNTKSQARQIISTLETQGEIYLQIPIDSNLTLLDYSINLGTAHYHPCCIEVLNLDELQQKLAIEPLNDTEDVDLVFALDLPKSYMEFEDWLSTED